MIVNFVAYVLEYKSSLCVLRTYLATEMLSALVLVSTLSGRRPALPFHAHQASSVRGQRVVCSAPVNEAPTIDLAGDGGVLKAITRTGAGNPPQRGATVEVHYVGKLLDTGAVFDSSRARGKVIP